MDQPHVKPGPHQLHCKSSMCVISLRSASVDAAPLGCRPLFFRSDELNDKTSSASRGYAFIDDPEVNDLVVSLQVSHCPAWSAPDNTWAAHSSGWSQTSYIRLYSARTWSDTNRTSSGVICIPSETSLSTLILRRTQVHYTHKSNFVQLHHACCVQPGSWSSTCSECYANYRQCALEEGIEKMTVILHLQHTW